jgi:hypothetical protein
MNAHFQCKIFDQLLTDERVLPIAPLELFSVQYPAPWGEKIGK